MSAGADLAKSAETQGAQSLIEQKTLRAPLEQVLIGSRNEQEIRALLSAWAEADEDD